MIRYRILTEHRLVVLCFWGATDEQEVIALSGDLRKNPEFSDSYDALAETTNLQHAVSTQEIHDLAEPRIAMSAGSRLAVVAPEDFAYGPSRMHQLLSEGRNPLQIEVFRDRKSALAWLGREGLDLELLCEELRKGT